MKMDGPVSHSAHGSCAGQLLWVCYIPYVSSCKQRDECSARAYTAEDGQADRAHKAQIYRLLQTTSPAQLCSLHATCTLRSTAGSQAAELSRSMEHQPIHTLQYG